MGSLTNVLHERGGRMNPSEERPRLPFDSSEIHKLRHQGQKPFSEEALEAWLFHRRISIYVTRTLLDQQWATPNLITTVGIILASSGVLTTWLLPDTYRVWFGLLLYHLAYLFDVVDGELARLKDLRSSRGIWLDRLLAEAMNALVMITTWKYAARMGMHIAIPILLLAMGLRIAGRSGYEQLHASARGAPMANVKNKYLIVNVLSMLSSPGGLLLWLALGELTKLYSAFLVLGLVLFMLSSAYQLLHYWRSLE